MNYPRVVIAGEGRSAFCGMGAQLAPLSPAALGGHVVRGMLIRSGLPQEKWHLIDELLLGCVVQGGAGQALGRNVLLNAGLDLEQVGAGVVNRVCASSLWSVILAYQAIRSGEGNAYIAGGAESASSAPYGLRGVRSGLGWSARKGTFFDLAEHDSLTCFESGQLMLMVAEAMAKELGISKERQDEFAIESYLRTWAAIQAGTLSEEIIPIPVPQRKGDPVIVDKDGRPLDMSDDKKQGWIDKITGTPSKTGTITVWNASSIDDGAVALLICTDTFAKEHGLTILAEVSTFAIGKTKPHDLFTSPVVGMQQLMERAEITDINAIDRVEITEAFAAQMVACEYGLKWDVEFVNPDGGAISGGHPVAASGGKNCQRIVRNIAAGNIENGAAGACRGGGEGVWVYFIEYTS